MPLPPAASVSLPLIAPPTVNALLPLVADGDVGSQRHRAGAEVQGVRAAEGEVAGPGLGVVGRERERVAAGVVDRAAAQRERAGAERRGVVDSQRAASDRDSDGEAVRRVEDQRPEPSFHDASAAGDLVLKSIPS